MRYAILSLLLPACAPSLWVECYTSDEMAAGVPLVGCPIQAEVCTEDSCWTAFGWERRDGLLYAYEYNDQSEEDPLICVTWFDCEEGAF